MDGAPVETVLVGVDGSDESMKAADYAVEIAARYDAELVVLHVVDSAEYRAMEAGDRDAAAVSTDAQVLIDEVTDRAGSAGVACRGASAFGFDVKRKLVHPGSVVLDVAEEFEADFIVLPRGPFEGAPGDEGTLSRAAEYALLYASQPVLSV